MDIIDTFNQDLFRARTHFNLRHNSLHAETWEQAVAEAFGGTWVKGSADLADAYHSSRRVIYSVKSRKVEPQRKKRIQSRDFVSHPEYFHFGGAKFSEIDLDNLHTVSRRCSIPGLNEHTSPAKDIGKTAINDYESFENRSLIKFDCDHTVDVVIVHGETADLKKYHVRVMFFDHQLNDIVEWKEVLHGTKSKFQGKRAMILGFDQHGPHIGRISNLGRQQTCMLRFYRKSQAQRLIDLTIPRPKPEKFDFDSEFLLLK